MFGPKKSKQVLTHGPGVTNVNGPAFPEVQIEVFVLHWAFAELKLKKEKESRRVTSKDLVYFITVVSKM